MQTNTHSDATGAFSGSLFVVSAPSGAGKTSLLQALINQNEKTIEISVSHTTRSPRPGEIDGVNYHFVDESIFKAQVASNEFLEYAQVFDYNYGTLKANLFDKLSNGVDVILEIDWQGARQIKERFPPCVSIFILPPSRQDLEKRLHGRGQDSEKVIERRLRDAVADMKHCSEYDYTIINDSFDVALKELQTAIDAQRLSTKIQFIKQKVLIGELLD